jgi:uncharacterized membrane protein
MLMSAAVTCFIGTLLTDLAYWRTADILWTDFSNWLVSAGVVIACLGLLTAIYDHVDSRVRSTAVTWPYLVGLVAVLIFAIFNMLIHTHDAWTSVVPWGLTLSVAVVVVALVTGWMGRSMIYRAGGEVRV